MRYQLLLQFRGDSLEDYDAMIALEDTLIDALRDSAQVDGHDVGSGEVNIFILTDEPEQTFQQARPLLELRGRLPVVTAAYRSVTGESYIVIWPENSREVFKIA